MFLLSLLTWFLLAGTPVSKDGGYGQVVFPNSGSGAVQKDFLDGVALLHDRANRRRLGHITKQGSSIVRFLLVEAA